MPIKNFWSLEPGEAMVAETMRHQLPGWEIFFPVKDIGVDLLAVREAGTSRGRMLTIQVKESKAYERRDRDVTPVDSVTGWFVLNPPKTRRSIPRVNFYVFVCSHYKFAGTRKLLTVSYVIVPTQELIRRLNYYKPHSEQRWDLYLVVEPNRRCLDWRGIGRKNKDTETARPERDYSEFLNIWNQMDSAFSR